MADEKPKLVFDENIKLLLPPPPEEVLRRCETRYCHLDEEVACLRRAAERYEEWGGIYARGADSLLETDITKMDANNLKILNIRTRELIEAWKLTKKYTEEIEKVLAGKTNQFKNTKEGLMKSAQQEKGGPTKKPVPTHTYRYKGTKEQLEVLFEELYAAGKIDIESYKNRGAITQHLMDDSFEWEEEDKIIWTGNIREYGYAFNFIFVKLFMVTKRDGRGNFFKAYFRLENIEITAKAVSRDCWGIERDPAIEARLVLDKIAEKVTNPQKG